MVVICDTSPLNYLARIGSIDTIRQRFGEVVIPGSVLRELQHADAPPPVREWAKQLPSWILIREPTVPLTCTDLGSGERDAISLAVELKADVILLDDLAARDEAMRRGLRVAGTLGIVAEAHRHGWLDFDAAIFKLRALNFRISDALIDQVRTQLSIDKQA